MGPLHGGYRELIIAGNTKTKTGKVGGSNLNGFTNLKDEKFYASN